MSSRVRMLWTILIACWICQGCRCPGTCLAGSPPTEGEFTAARERLVEVLRRQGITDKRVLAAIHQVPRHKFVPDRWQDEAYANHPLPIGQDQTISQPYIVAYMTQALKLTGDEKVLEVGTGSGYQAAVLALTAGQVYSVEILPELSARAGKVLDALGYDNVHLKVGDGFDGWREHAPYDAVIVTAAPRKIPAPLVAQLKDGGRLSIPVGPAGDQVLKTFVKRDGKLVQVDRLGVRFVPMTGKALR